VRPAIRRRNNLVLTNPDMLHVAVLPNHKKWGDFLANLRWVVVDEAPPTRGLRLPRRQRAAALRRLARAYGAEPRFLLASATIAQPGRARRAAGRDAVPADRRRRRAAGRRELAIWNPPLIDERSGTRRSALGRGADLLAELVSHDVRTICFLKSRRGSS